MLMLRTVRPQTNFELTLEENNDIIIVPMRCYFENFSITLIVNEFLALALLKIIFYVSGVIDRTE